MRARVPPRDARRQAARRTIVVAGGVWVGGTLSAEGTEGAELLAEDAGDAQQKYAHGRHAGADKGDVNLDGAPKIWFECYERQVDGLHGTGIFRVNETDQRDEAENADDGIALAQSARKGNNSIIGERKTRLTVCPR